MISFKKKKGLTVLLMAGLVLPIFLQLFSHVVQSNALVSQVSYVLSKVLFIVVPLLFWLLTRNPIVEQGGKLKRFSIASGLFLAVVIFAILQIGMDFVKPHGESIYQTLTVLGLTQNFLLYSGLIIVINSLLEELYWRYSIFGGLKRMMSLSMAMLVSSLGFMAMHLMYFVGLFESLSVIVLLTLTTFAFGIFWAWLYEKTRSIPHVWINHMLVNLPLFYTEYLIISNF